MGTLGFLQCLADTNSTLGECVTKMLDPDVYPSIELPYIQALKGNARLLFAADVRLREEALCRLIYLLGKEKDSSKKLPRLSSLHGLPLSSLCILERAQNRFKRCEGSYQTTSLLSVMELIKTTDVEPKVRKSALVQISVMLTDTCLHKLFLRQNGLELSLQILDKSLVRTANISSCKINVFYFSLLIYLFNFYCLLNCEYFSSRFLLHVNSEPTVGFDDNFEYFAME